MQQDVERFLNLRNPPGRLTREQTAWFLGFTPEEITMLIARGLLKPLGHPAHNGQKYFLAKTLEDLRRDEKWFGKASDAIVEYWRHKNDRKGQDAPAIGEHTKKRVTEPDLADVEH
jgi:hypothetical protein